MNGVINGLKCPPSYSPIYVDFLCDSSEFFEITQNMKSFTLSGISGGGGGGIGGVHDSNSYTEQSFNNCEPPSAGGGGSGYINTIENIKIDNFLSMFDDINFIDGYEYGLMFEIGSGGSAGISYAENIINGANGGNTKIFAVKRNASTKDVVKKINIFDLTGGNGSAASGGVGVTDQYGITVFGSSSGGNGGYGGRAGVMGYANLDVINATINGAGSNGDTEYCVKNEDGEIIEYTKKYLLDDPTSKCKCILGRGGTHGAGHWWYSTIGFGVDPEDDEVSYGAGGKGGDSVGIANERFLSTGTCAGTNGQKGVVGVRIYYKFK